MPSWKQPDDSWNKPVERTWSKKECNKCGAPYFVHEGHECDWGGDKEGLAFA